MKIAQKFAKLKLFSPILVKGEALYENPWDGGEDFRLLTEPEKKKCQVQIYESVCETLAPIVAPQELARKIYSAVPAVEEKDGRVMLVLNCECFGTLSESQLDTLCEWWENRVIEANERLKNTAVKTPKLGRIYINIWFINGWAVEPIFVGVGKEMQEGIKYE